jgi:hypothetical protein
MWAAACTITSRTPSPGTYASDWWATRSSADDAGFPQRLLEYAENVRNRAMHVDDLTLDDCKVARDYLFEEPVRLLLDMTSALRDVG